MIAIVVSCAFTSIYTLIAFRIGRVYSAARRNAGDPQSAWNVAMAAGFWPMTVLVVGFCVTMSQDEMDFVYRTGSHPPQDGHRG